MTTSPKTTKDEVLKLALNELEELTSVAAQCDSWQSFPYEPLEKAYATITAIREALAQPAADDKAVQRMVHDFPALSAFHEKYALGPMAKPSCLCCGHVPEEVAIKHMELPGIVICKKCRDAALLADDKAGWEVAAWQERQEQAPGEFTVWYSCKACKIPWLISA